MNSGQDDAAPASIVEDPASDSGSAAGPSDLDTLRQQLSSTKDQLLLSVQALEANKRPDIESQVPQSAQRQI